MKITVLASGSKGNITLVETKTHNILIDAGITYSNILKRNNRLPDIDMIIVTHTHIDHVYGLHSFIKKYNPVVLSRCINITEYSNKAKITDLYEDDKLQIELFPLSHDVPCSGILIKEDNKELVYATDTGYINEKILDKITNKNIYIIESNHDEEMLRHGKYPFYLQQRIRSEVGHLSNETTSSYLKKLVGDKTSYVVLAHISKENNKPEIAYSEAKNNLIDKNIQGLYTAKQDEILEVIEV